MKLSTFWKILTILLMTSLLSLLSLTLKNCWFNFFLQVVAFLFDRLFTIRFNYILFFWLIFSYLFIYFLYSILMNSFKPDLSLRVLLMKFIFLHCIWFCMLLLFCGTYAYLSSTDEGSCYVFMTRNNCCEFLAYYGVNLQNVH